MDFLESYLKVAPLAHAVWRSSEAGELEKISLPRPLLDLGCGFGEFAGVFFDSVVEVGVDISFRDVFLAARGKKYRRVKCEDARKMSFRGGSFASVLSVSVLEHIPRVNQVLAEVHRILVPCGRLVFTVPSDKFSRLLLGTRLFGRSYARAVNRVFRHHNLWPQGRWRRCLEQAGFSQIQIKGIVPLSVFRVWEWGLPAALPSQIGKVFWGRRFVWRPAGAAKWLARGLDWLIQTKPEATTNWLISARK